MNVLIFTTSRGFLDEVGEDGSDTRARHELYLDELQRLAPGSDLRILVLARDEPASLGWRRRGRLQVAAVGARSLIAGAVRLAAILAAPGSTLFGDWRPDLITSQSPLEDGLLGALLARRLRARHMAQAHFQLAQIGTDYRPAIRKRLLPVVFALSQSIRFVSGVQRQVFAEAYALPDAKTFVCPVPMLSQALARADGGGPAGEREPLCLFAGRFVAQKNLPAWIEIATQVAERLPQARFGLAGDGPLRRQIQSLVSDRGLAGRFEFYGDLSTARLAELYRRTAVFLLTSRDDAFGRVVAEAGAFGIPVVSTRCGGPEEIILAGETGLLRPEGDIPGLTEDVFALLDDTELRTRLGEAARRHVHALYDARRLSATLASRWIQAATGVMQTDRQEAMDTP
jgi:glycosyltransferase involved in cell wall biosynthesis